MTIPIIASLLLGAASAKAHTTPLVGTWTGMVGKAKVNVCFQSFSDGGYRNGSYYYLRHRVPIQLDNLDDKIWLEPDSNRMVFETITESVATGRWIGFKSGKELPVRLRFLGICPEDEGNTSTPCACDLFNKPIETMPVPKIETLGKGTRQCRRTIRLESGSIGMEWFELCGTDEAARKISERLRSSFPDPKTGAAAFFECRRNTMGAFGSASCELNRTTAPHFWNNRLLVVSEAEGGFCGGAHDFGGVRYPAFDLETGETVDPASWLDPDSQDTLNALLLERILADSENVSEECKGVVQQDLNYSLRIDSTGIAFYTEFGHCCRACDVEQRLSFQELSPFLSQEGKAALERYMGIRRKRAMNRRRNGGWIRNAFILFGVKPRDGWLISATTDTVQIQAALAK